MNNIDINLFGPISPYIMDDNVTDINWNGSDLWIDDLNKGRYKAEEISLDMDFLERFTSIIKNMKSNGKFSQYDPVLEAETDSLRIEIVHESRTATGRVISIRKTPAVKRITSSIMKQQEYCPDELMLFLAAAVKAHCNFLVAGLPGAGKTEFVKTLTSFIPANEKVITIEDTFEIRYSSINPGRDCIEFKVDTKDDSEDGNVFTYRKAITTCMRLLPNWLIVSEVRGEEVQFLIQAETTGVSGMSTIHTNDVNNIEDRIKNMSRGSSEELVNDIYSTTDIAILVRKQQTSEGFKRNLEQVAFFSRVDGKNTVQMLFDKGKFINTDLPADIAQKFYIANVKNPLAVPKERLK